jgi:hypothetical protein
MYYKLNMDFSYMLKQFPYKLHVWISRYCPPTKVMEPSQLPLYSIFIYSGSNDLQGVSFAIFGHWCLHSSRPMDLNTLR